MVLNTSQKHFYFVDFVVTDTSRPTTVAHWRHGWMRYTKLNWTELNCNICDKKLLCVTGFECHRCYISC